MRKSINTLQFNFNSLQDFYLQNGFLKQAEFDLLIKHTNAVRSLEIADFNWLPIDQAAGQFGHLPMSVHYRAMAQSYGMTYRGIEDFYVQCINSGSLEPHVLNFTKFYESPANITGYKIGQLLIRLGLISHDTLYKALGLQQVIQSEVGTKPFLALIVNKISNLSAPNLYQALGIQGGVDFISLDESVDKITIGIKPGTSFVRPLP
jgi:hypothetical protein